MKKIVFFVTALSGCLCYAEEPSVVTPDNKITDNDSFPEDENLPTDLDEEDDDGNDFGGMGALGKGIINSPNLIKQGINLLEQSTKAL